MKVNFFIFVLLAVVLATGFAQGAVVKTESSMQPGHALSGGSSSANDKFNQMDADKNGKVDWEEFSIFYPKMQRAAFEMIDSTQDGFIVPEEWEDFFNDHQHNMGVSKRTMGGMKMSPTVAAEAEEETENAPQPGSAKAVGLLPLTPRAPSGGVDQADPVGQGDR